MTRSASGTLATKFDNTTTTLARLWTITRKDATVIYLTDHDQDLPVGGNLYLSAQGFTASSLLISTGAPVQGIEIVALADAVTGIDPDDVNAGIYDGASCLLQLVDFENVAGGTMTMFGGVIAETLVDIRHNELSLTVNGIFTRGRQVKIESWSSSCRADLGDARCTVDIDAIKVPVTITAFDSQYTFEDTTLTVADDFFALGLVHWLTGNNAGLSFEVKSNVSATDKITQFMPSPFVYQVGDTANVYPGCDKQLSTCRDLYANAINFRGEPFIPNQKLSI